ncbi:MAG: aroma-sacti cluster domain-containing protein [Actinocrinis sp.]
MSAEDAQRGDALSMLVDAGFRFDGLTDEQREVVRGLSADEVEILVAIGRRITDTCVDAEVVAHAEIAGGLLF